MKKPLVSVIVPIYNHEKYLNECLNSFLNLDYDNIEFVLCNDGSSDSSFTIAQTWIEEHGQLNIKLLTQENKGICRTLNRLIKEAHGEFIAICASDDTLTSNGLKERVNALESNPDKLACIGDAFLIDQYSNVISESAMQHLYKSSYIGLANNIRKELVLRWAVVGPTLLIRRTTYEKLGYYNENMKVEDRDYFLKLLGHNVLVFIPVPVACYRIHTDNSSRRSIESKLLVLRDVAISNVNHANIFFGTERLFLLSHKVDILLAKPSRFHFFYFSLSIYRLVRKLLVKVIL